MAKKSHALVRASSPIVVMPRRGRVRRFAGRAASGGGRLVRRAGSNAKSGALPLTGVAIGALAAGFLDGKGYLAKLPALGGSHTFTLGALGAAAAMFVKNKHVRTAGLAAVAVAAYDFAKTQAGGVSGINNSTEGDDGGQGF